MSTSKRLGARVGFSTRGRALTCLIAFFALFALFASASAGCDAVSAGSCLRFSDCATGLTCAAGLCVTPPSTSDASVVSPAVVAPATGDNESTMAPTTAPTVGDEPTDEPGNLGSDDASSPSTE